MQHNIKEAVVNAWEAAWDRGEVDAFDAILHPDYRRQSTSSGHVSDIAGLKLEIQQTRTAFPDLVTVVDEIVIDTEAQTAAIFWHSEGTFSNDLAGVPATGNRVHTRGSNQVELKDGLIYRELVTWDHGELLADVGIPSLRSAFENAPEEVVVDDFSGKAGHDALLGFNRKFITGVTVVTTVDSEGNPRGLAANSYASVSLEPPLVLVCVQKTSSTYPALFQATHLGINIMSNAQRDVVGVFASKVEDKFGKVSWHEGPNKSPMIDGSAASIEAEIKERFQAKTHTVFIARVTHAELAELEPMIYKGGKFFDGAELTSLD